MAGIEEKVKTGEETNFFGESFLKDKVVPKGFFEYTVLEEGRIVDSFSEENLITKIGLEALTRLLAIGDGTNPGDPDNRIKGLQLGVKGYDPSQTPLNVFIPRVPSVNDTSLVQVNLNKFPGIGSFSEFEFDSTINRAFVKFCFSIGNSEGNSPDPSNLPDPDQSVYNPSTGTIVYTEAALVTNENTLFSVKTFPGLTKTSNRKIRIEWTIAF